MLALITDLRLCALMSLRPYVLERLICLRIYVLRTFVGALVSSIEKSFTLFLILKQL